MKTKSSVYSTAFTTDVCAQFWASPTRVHLFISSSERAVGRCGDDRIQADATLSRVARTPCQDAGPYASQDVPVWMAAPDTALWRSKKKVEGLGEEGPEGYGDW